MTPHHATLGHALRAAAGGAGGLVLVGEGEREERVGFGELHERARRAAGALLDAGVRRGDRVAIVAPTGWGFCDAFFGAVLAGAVPVPLYPPVRLGRLDDYHAATATMLGRVEARVVVADPKVRLLLGESLDRARPPLGCLTTTALGEGAPRDESGAMTPDALGLIQFSSGSTAAPRPVALSHRALMAQCEALPALFPPVAAGERAVGCSWLPLYHDMGLIGCLLEAVYVGGDLVLIPPERFLVRPSLWLRAIARHRARVSPAPSFSYALCARRIRDEELTGLDLSSWTYALCGAEPVAADALRAFADRFARFGFAATSLMPVYGLSESSLAVTYSPPGRPLRLARVDAARLAAAGEVTDGEREIASVGVPVPGTEVEVRDEHGNSLQDGRVGRIFVASPSLMDGYFGDPEATARTLHGRWLDTGDLGFWHGGELHIAGRAKDVIIVRGANHAPQEFEAPVDAVPGVRLGCSVAVGFEPPGTGGEELLLLVERATGAAGEGDAALASAVQAAVVAATGVRPHTVEVLAPGTLPRTSSGKLRRRESLARFLAGTLTPPDATGAVPMARALARSLVGHARASLGTRR